MKKLLSLLCLIVFFLVSCQKTQNKSSVTPNQSMAVSSELSNQRIKAFAEDSLGHIWIGTFRGLNRYNSVDFHQYFCTDSCIDIPDNQICALFNDSHNRLWVATINGTSIYTNNGHFLRIKNVNPPSSTPIQIFESQDKQVFINYRTHLDKYDETKEEFIPALSLEVKNDRSDVWCYFDRRNKLWVVEANKIRCFQPDTYQLIDSLTLPIKVQTHFMDTENDQLWLGGNKYLGIYDLRNRKMIQLPSNLANHPSLLNANIINIYKYEDGYWLFNTSNYGLIVYNSTNERIWKEGENGYPFELPGFRIESFFTDSNKNLWVGSYDKGIAIINRFQRLFNSNIALHSFLHRRSVNSVDYDKDGNLWMASFFDGLFAYNLTSAKAFDIDIYFSSGEKHSPSISLVKVTKDGLIWLASLVDHKVWKGKWSGKEFHVIKEYDVKSPLSIIEDSQGALWIGSGQKWIYRYNVDSDDFESMEIGFGPEDNCFVSGLADAGDKIYVGAFMRPLMQAKYENNEIKIDTIHVDGWDKMILRGHFMPTDMLYDSFGDLWIGTVGNGLLRYNPETKQLIRIGKVPCTDIASIEEDKQGHIWISTQYGLSRYIRNSGRVQTYYVSDGTGGNQFYDRSSVILPNGKMIFGGTHGITSFNPIDAELKNRMRLVFEDLKIHNTIIDPLINPDNLKTDLSVAKAVNLERGQNSFSISFAALDFASNVKPRYSYFLENYDPHWIEDRNTNEASYSNLPSGHYTLRVRITDDSETLIGDELSIHIHVKGNPWTSWWAIVAYVLIAIILIYIVLNRILKIPVKLEINNNSEKGTKNEDNDTQISSHDQKLMEELQELMEKEIANPDIDINQLAKIMRISRTKLYYKVKAITGQNPSVYVKSYKLERAAKLLREGKYSIGEIAEMTGFSTTAHFSTSFKKKFGKTPTEFIR